MTDDSILTINQNFVQEPYNRMSSNPTSCIFWLKSVATFYIYNILMKSIIYALLLAVVLTSSIKDQISLAITIYNDNFALIKDVRTIEFTPKSSYLYFSDVASTIETQTVTFKALDANSSISLFEQNYQNNLVGKYSILKKYLNKQISVIVKNGQQAKHIKGKLISYEPAFILQNQDGVQLYDKVEAVELPSLPEGLLTVPTLVWKVHNPHKETIQTGCEVAYRATGFSWKADYSLTLNADESMMDFSGWVTIDNQSGKKYENAKIKLIAGEVNIVRPTTNYYAQPVMMMETMAGSVADSGFKQKSFADYHMYTLGRQVNVNESSKKQIQFVPVVHNVKIRKYHKVIVNLNGYTQENIKAQNNVHFLNSENIGMGIPLPKGTIRVFKADTDRSLEFVGENSIDHTPKDQKVDLNIGKSFDIVVKKTVTSRTDVSNGYDAKVKLEITNHKESQQEIEVQLLGFNSNMKIQWNSNLALQKQNANKYLLKFSVTSNAKQVFEWDQNVRY